MYVLYWVACSRRALSIPEITTMLGVRRGMRSHGNGIVFKHNTLKQKISKHCGPLVRFVQRKGRDVVVLAHASVKEFLLGKFQRERSTFFHQKESEIEASLAIVCLTYLCFDDIESPPFKIMRKNESWISCHLSQDSYRLQLVVY